MLVNHPGCVVALGLLLGPLSTLRAQERFLLRENPVSGGQYRVHCGLELSGTLALASEKNQGTSQPFTLRGTSTIEYDERLLAVDARGQVQKTARVYRKLDVRRQVGGQPQENSLRPAVRRLVIQRRAHQEVPYSPDGPLLWSEIDLLRTDVFTPALDGLFSEQTVRVGDRWDAARSAIEELTDLERIEEGRIECRLDEVSSLNQRRFARVTLSGTVRGFNAEGSSRQRLDGSLYFDLDTRYLSYLSFRGTQFVLDKEGKEVGSLTGQFVLTRQHPVSSADFSEAALKDFAPDPTEDQTALLFDDASFGARFVYPRRWRVNGATGRQVTLDEAAGNGLVLTLDPAGKGMSGERFLEDSRSWLFKKNARILRVVPPQRIQAAPREIERFTIEAEVDRQRTTFLSYLVRQPSGTATLSARLLPDAAPRLLADVEKVARSLTLVRPAGESAAK